MHGPSAFIVNAVEHYWLSWLCSQEDIIASSYVNLPVFASEDRR